MVIAAEEGPEITVTEARIQELQGPKRTRGSNGGAFARIELYLEQGAIADSPCPCRQDRLAGVC